MPIRGEHVAAPANSTATPLIKDIFGVSADFLGQLRTWFEQNPPAIPVSQIVGFNQFTVQDGGFIATPESTTLVTYGNLTTTGPSLSSLPDGKYVIFFGAASKCATAGHGAAMSIAINAAAASDNERAVTNSDQTTTIVRATIQQLSAGGSNTITAKYRSGVATEAATFQDRWMIAIRISS